MTTPTFKLDRLAMHEEWFDKNRTLLFIEASVVMQELLAMCRQYKAERDEARRSVCEMCVEHGGVFRRVGGKTVEVTTAEECAEIMRWDCFKEKP